MSLPPPTLLSDAILVSTSLPLSLPILDEIRTLKIVLPPTLVNATEKRKEEFLAGRYCALMALKGAASEVGQAPDGSPLWPPGRVGSITHARGLAAAAVAPTHVLGGLGIDSEPVMSEERARKVMHRILTTSERERARDPQWVTLVFSAKESIYKCLRPLCGAFFGFEAAELFKVDIDRGEFCFRLLADIGGDFKRGFEGRGRFSLTDEWVHTAVELPTRNH